VFYSSASSFSTGKGNIFFGYANFFCKKSLQRDSLSPREAISTTVKKRQSLFKRGYLYYDDYGTERLSVGALMFSKAPTGQ